MKYALLFTALLSITIFSQTYHSISIDGIKDFNTASEQFNTTSGTLKSFITWDKDYIYIGLSGESSGGNITENDRAYFIYFDTDPKQNPTQGTGTREGANWRFSPVLPFSANYRYVFKTRDNTEFKDVYQNSNWSSTNFLTSNFKGNGYWECKIKISDLGNPSQVNLIMYVLEDWQGGKLCGGVPSNLFDDVIPSSQETFTNNFYNFNLLSDVAPNISYNLNNYQWTIRLKAGVAGIVDSSSYAGMSKNATNNFDANIDIPNPPTPPSNYVDVYFPRADWTNNLGPFFSRDIKAIINLDSMYVTWGLSVNTDKVNQNVVIIGEQFTQIPSNYSIIINDVDKDVMHDLRSGNYIYNSGSSAGIKNFNLIIGNIINKPILSFPNTTADFGNVSIGKEAALNFVIKNSGDTTLKINSLNLTGNGFSYNGSTNFTISKKDSVVLQLKFAPVAIQKYDGSLVIVSNDDRGTVIIPLVGHGVQKSADIHLPITSYTFGEVKSGSDSSKQFKVYNNGDTTLVISKIVSSGNAFLSSAVLPLSINKNDSTIVTFTFRPNAASVFSGTMSIISNDPDEDTVVVNLTGTGISSVFANKFAPGWNMISIPAIPMNTHKSTIIGDDINTYYLFTYNNGYINADSVSPGRGYMIGIQDTLNLDVDGIGNAQNTAISLKSGWNLTASPFFKNYLKKNIYVARNGIGKKLNDAVSAGWLQDQLYTYGKSGYSSSDTLKIWSGYWLAALTDSLNIIYYIDSANTGTEALYAEKPNAANWELNITASTNNHTDKLLTIGANVSATDGFDAGYDYAKPPVIPNNNLFETYFEHSDWSSQFFKYAKDIKKDFGENESGKSWSFKISTYAANTITLSWDNIAIPENIKNKYGFILVGPGVPAGFNMMKNNQVEIALQQGSVNSYSINMNVVGVEDEKLNKFSYKLEQNYPNPFNPSTIITFELPKEELVSLSIYDVLGRKVKDLICSNLSSGVHQVEFNAENLSAGIYYYTLKAGSYTQTKKMILVK